jgi:hypothetical protein
MVNEKKDIVRSQGWKYLRSRLRYRSG